MTTAARWLRSPRTLDVLLTMVVLASALAERLSEGGNASPALLALTVLVALPLLVRRTATLAAAAAFLALAALLVVAGIGTDSAAGAWLVALLLGYSTGRHARRWYGLPELALLVIANEVLWGLATGSIPSDLTFPAAFTACAWAVGRWVRHDARIAARVHEETAFVQERAEVDRERARAAERRRIAREMHDVIAHSVSVMVVQAGGARIILDQEPARAIAAASLIEQTGREALEELRALLGVIGAAPEQAGAPAPSLTRLEELVERGTNAGLQVDLRCSGELDGLPAGVDMAGYRIVQEALTNALRHAGPVATRVEVRRAGSSIQLEIRSARPRPDHELVGLTRPGGHGMMGMAERATLYGGELDAGPTPDGGFRVHTTLTFQDHHMEDAA